MYIAHEMRRQIVRLCENHGVKELYVFGPASPEGAGPHHNIDMVVVFSQTIVAGSFDRYFDLKAELEQSLRQPVSLVCDATVRDRVLRQEIDQTKERIYPA